MLSDADGASAGDLEAVGTIEDDDEPAVTGDLLPLTCISAKLDDGPCGIEDPSLSNLRDVAGTIARFAGGWVGRGDRGFVRHRPADPLGARGSQRRR